MKNHQASDGCHFTEATWAILSLQGGVGGCAQAKERGWAQGWWPGNSAEFLLCMLNNAESSAELEGSDADSLLIEPIQGNTAPEIVQRLRGSWVEGPTHKLLDLLILLRKSRLF